MARWKPNVEPPEIESPDQRAARVERLRQAYTDGSIDLTVSAEHEGVDRLLEDLFREKPERRRRSNR
ncbi:MAG: hypothetical protein ABMA64_31225 [Myxococcota bacterium]